MSKVKIPTRPTNITKHKINLPEKERFEVKPRDSPTVPNADTTSKHISKKVAFSKIRRLSIAENITNSDKTIDALALEIVDGAIDR